MVKFQVDFRFPERVNFDPKNAFFRARPSKKTIYLNFRPKKPMTTDFLELASCTEAVHCRLWRFVPQGNCGIEGMESAKDGTLTTNLPLGVFFTIGVSHCPLYSILS